MVLVTGAGGQVGRSLIQTLSAKGISVRAWIHREEQKESVLSSGASEIYIGDLALKENAAKAMKGTDTVFFICNTANPREDEIGAHLIRTAKELGNITFIYHSVLHSLLSDMPHHDRKRKVEKTLIDSGIPYVILQPGVFMQMLLPSIRSVKNGDPFVQKFYASRQTKMSFVDMKDYGEAAARIIASGTFTYGTYEFCSNDPCSLTDMENILSQLTGRTVTSAFISDEDFLENSHMSPDSYAGQTLLTMFRHYNKSSFCGNSFTITQILDRNPVSVRDYLAENLETAKSRSSI